MLTFLDLLNIFIVTYILLFFLELLNFKDFESVQCRKMASITVVF